MSGGEIFIIFLAVLLLFGSDKIPEIAKIFGKGMREFRKATDDIKQEFEKATNPIEDEVKKIGNSVEKEVKNIEDSVENEVDDFKESIHEELKDPMYSVHEVEGGNQPRFRNTTQKTSDDPYAIPSKHAVKKTEDTALETEDSSRADATEAESTNSNNTSQTNTNKSVDDMSLEDYQDLDKS